MTSSSLSNWCKRGLRQICRWKYWLYRGKERVRSKSLMTGREWDHIIRKYISYVTCCAVKLLPIHIIHLAIVRFYCCCRCLYLLQQGVDEWRNQRRFVAGVLTCSSVRLQSGIRFARCLTAAVPNICRPRFQIKLILCRQATGPRVTGRKQFIYISANHC